MLPWYIEYVCENVNEDGDGRLNDVRCLDWSLGTSVDNVHFVWKGGVEI